MDEERVFAQCAEEVDALAKRVKLLHSVRNRNRVVCRVSCVAVCRNRCCGWYRAAS